MEISKEVKQDSGSTQLQIVPPITSLTSTLSLGNSSLQNIIYQNDVQAVNSVNLAQHYCNLFLQKAIESGKINDANDILEILSIPIKVMNEIRSSQTQQMKMISEATEKSVSILSDGVKKTGEVFASAMNTIQNIQNKKGTENITEQEENSNLMQTMIQELRENLTKEKSKYQDEKKKHLETIEQQQHEIDQLKKDLENERSTVKKHENTIKSLNDDIKINSQLYESDLQDLSKLRRQAQDDKQMIEFLQQQLIDLNQQLELFFNDKSTKGEKTPQHHLELPQEFLFQPSSSQLSSSPSSSQPSTPQPSSSQPSSSQPSSSQPSSSQSSSSQPSSSQPSSLQPSSLQPSSSSQPSSVRLPVSPLFSLASFYSYFKT